MIDTARYSRFAGTSVERDFVEAPSQMLENWCYDAVALRRISSHYQTGRPLPDEMIEKLVAAKNVNAGLLNLRQIFFGLFDMTAHTTNATMTSAEAAAAVAANPSLTIKSEEVFDSTRLWEQLRESVTLIPHHPDTFPAATFGHLMGGYDCGYYGYLFSDMYASAFFERFQQAGVFDQTLGRKYRECILSPGEFSFFITFIANQTKKDTHFKLNNTKQEEQSMEKK